MTNTCRSISTSRFAENDQDVIQRFGLICPICQATPLPEDAVLTKGCNHLFCKSCLLTSYSKSQTCPTCRQSLSVKSFQDSFDTSLSLLRMLSSLKVRCSEENTCSWIGSLDDLTKHVLACKNTESFPCPNGCNQFQNRNTWQSHTTNCTFRTINCVHCNIKITPVTTNEHLTICPELTVDCPYKLSGCLFQTRRIALSEHLISASLTHAEQSNATIWELQQEVRSTQVITMPILVHIQPGYKKNIGTLLDKTWGIQVANQNDQLIVAVNIEKIPDVTDNVITATFSMKMYWVVKHPTGNDQDIDRITEWRNINNQGTFRTNLILPITWLVPNKGLIIIVKRLMLYDWVFPDYTV